jgi:autonomous glycyl radical cofactor GrcA
MAKFFAANPPHSPEALAATAVTRPAPASVVGRAGSVAIGEIGGIAIRNVTIDVGATTVVPTLVREGKEVVAPVFNPNRIDDFLQHSSTLPRLLIPVAISQSIPAGAMVAKGTPVDIVFAPMSNINFGLLDVVHEDFRNLSVTDTNLQQKILSDSQVTSILSKDVATVTPQEKQVISDKLRAINVLVDDNAPGKTFNLAFASLKSALAFQ